jgi:hypothetical protein
MRWADRRVSVDMLSDEERRVLEIMSGNERWPMADLSTALWGRVEECRLHKLLDGLIRARLVTIGIHHARVCTAYWLTERGQLARHRPDDFVAVRRG